MPTARETLLEAAHTAVGTQPWTGVRMVDVATAAGVSRQTLYNEFGTKGRPRCALVNRLVDGSSRGVRAAPKAAAAAPTRRPPCRGRRVDAADRPGRTHRPRGAHRLPGQADAAARGRRATVAAAGAPAVHPGEPGASGRHFVRAHDGRVLPERFLRPAGPGMRGRLRIALSFVVAPSSDGATRTRRARSARWYGRCSPSPVELSERSSTGASETAVARVSMCCSRELQAHQADDDQ